MNRQTRCAYREAQCEAPHETREAREPGHEAPHEPALNEREKWTVAETVDRKVGIPQDDKWYNNIFIQRGLEKVKEASGYASDGNLFLEGAGRSAFGDAHSIVDPLKTGFRREETPLGVTFTFAVGKAALDLRGPRVDAALVGVLPTVKQTIEDRHGKAISVDTDIRGLNRQDRVPGPLAGLKPEGNAITWSLEPAARLDEGKPAP